MVANDGLDDEKLDFAIEEVEKVAKQGMEPDWQPLLQQFPSHSEYIRNYFYVKSELLGLLPNFGPKYHVHRKLGGGGFGEVYLATHIELNRYVALKRANPWGSAKEIEIAKASLENERSKLVQMRHPNIAKLFDATKDLLVLEYINGKPITQFCDANSLGIPERLQLFLDVCHATMHFHQLGIVHMDLTDSNILVEESIGLIGVPKINDFGLSTQVNEPRKGEVAGTQDRVPPEWVNGGDPTTSGDIYLLGLILYDLLVSFGSDIRKSATFANSKRPLPSAFLNDLMVRDQEFIAECRNIPLHKLKSSLRYELDGVVKRAINEKPQERYGTVSDLAKAIESILKGERLPPSLCERNLSNFFYIVKKTFATNCVSIVFCSISVIIASLFLFLYVVSKADNLASETTYSQRFKQSSLKLLETMRHCGPEEFLVRIGDLNGSESALVARELITLQSEFPDDNATSIRRDAIIRTVITKRLSPGHGLKLILDSNVPEELFVISPFLTKGGMDDRQAFRAMLNEDTSSRRVDVSRPLGTAFLHLSLELSETIQSKFEKVFSQELKESASRLCDSSIQELDKWCSIYKSLGPSLADHLLVIARDNQERHSRRFKASAALAKLHSDKYDQLAKWLLELSSEVALPIMEQIKKQKNASAFKDAICPLELPTNDLLADKYVIAAIALNAIGNDELLSACLSGNAGECARSRAIVMCRKMEVPVNALIARTAFEKDDHTLASLIEAIGTYSPSEAAVNRHQEFQNLVQTAYLSNSSSHVHAACIWAMKAWGFTIPQVPISLVDDIKDKQWFRSPSNMDFLTLNFSQKTDSEFTYRIAVGTREVTVGDFSLFLEDKRKTKELKDSKLGLDLAKAEISPTADCPRNSISWHAAAEFCNWLSKRDAIDPTEFCFTVPSSLGNETSDVLTLRENAHTYNGYRMPTKEEAEFIARGLLPTFSRTTILKDGELLFPWGYDSKLLNDFAMTAENSKGRTWAAGSRLPNSFGAFDTLGSLLEWTITFDAGRTYAFCSGGNYINQLPMLFDPKPVAGGKFASTNFYYGLRVVRTISDGPRQIIGKVD